MKHIVSFSGGRTSAYLVHLMQEKRVFEGWDVEYVFMDTGAEHPETYKFINLLVKEWGIDLICLRPIVNPVRGVGMRWEVVPVESLKWDLSIFKAFNRKYGNMYAPMGGHCTTRLKQEVFKNYMNKYKGTDFTVWLGIREDEPRRLRERPNYKYLAEISDFEKSDVIYWWRERSFDLGIQEHLGNCIFCIKKSVNKVALAAKDEPEKWKEWSEMLVGARPMGALTHDVTAIYRGKLNPDAINVLYEDVDRDELHMTMRHAKKYESGSCSESCEVFNCD